MGWVPDDVGTAGRENLDPAHVARYDAKEEWNAAAEVALLRARGLLPAETVIDMGAGTGRFAREAAPHAARVVAVDPSPPMLERLRAIPGIECARAGFLSYEHTGPPADLVYSRYALHHLPDFWKAVALRRIAAMLRRGGALRLWDIVYGFDPGEEEAAVERWISEYEGASGWTRAELEEHIRDEHSTFTCCWSR